MGKRKSTKKLSIILLLSAIVIVIFSYLDKVRELDLRENGVRVTATYSESDLEGFVEKERTGRKSYKYVVDYEFDGISYSSALLGKNASDVRISINGSLPGPGAGDEIEIVVDSNQAESIYEAKDVDSDSEILFSTFITLLFFTGAVFFWNKEL